MKKDYINELIDWTKDIIPVTPSVLNLLGIPVTPQTITGIERTIKMLFKIGTASVFDDYKSRQLSSMQQNKLDDIAKSSIETIYRLIEKNGWEDNHPESAQYIQYTIEYSEDLLNKAINESRKEKRAFLGAYLGSTLYTLNFTTPNWDNVFYLSSVIDRLTLRQIILVKLIVEQFNGVRDGEEMICITNKVAISELRMLASQNMWVPLISYQPDPTYIGIPLKYICATDLAKELISNTLIPESLQGKTEEIVKTLDLKPFSHSGLPQPFRGLINIKLSKN